VFRSRNKTGLARSSQDLSLWIIEASLPARTPGSAAGASHAAEPADHLSTGRVCAALLVVSEMVIELICNTQDFHLRSSEFGLKNNV
jgi:hypothetical protein